MKKLLLTLLSLGVFSLSEAACGSCKKGCSSCDDKEVVKEPVAAKREPRREHRIIGKDGCCSWWREWFRCGKCGTCTEKKPTSCKRCGCKKSKKEKRAEVKEVKKA